MKSSSSSCGMELPRFFALPIDTIVVKTISSFLACCGGHIVDSGLHICHLYRGSKKASQYAPDRKVELFAKLSSSQKKKNVNCLVPRQGSGGTPAISLWLAIAVSAYELPPLHRSSFVFGTGPSSWWRASTWSGCVCSLCWSSRARLRSTWWTS